MKLHLKYFLLVMVLWIVNVSWVRAYQQAYCSTSENATTITQDCFFYESDETIKTFNIDINYNQPPIDLLVDYDAPDSSTRVLNHNGSQNKDTISVSFPGSRDTSQYVAEYSVTYNKNNIFTNPIVAKFDSVKNNTTDTQYVTIVNRNTLANAELSSANLMLYAPFQIVTYQSNNELQVEFKYDYIDESNPIDILAMSGKIEADLPIKNVYVLDYDFEGENTKLEYNQNTGDFLISFKLNPSADELDLENNLLKDLLCIELDTTNISSSNPTIITTKLSNLRYISSNNIDVEHKLNDIYSYKLLSNSNHILGDWNNDGEFNLVDVVRYRLNSSGYAKITSEYSSMEIYQKHLLDFNNDGSVDIIDLMQARRRLVGLPID